MKILLIIAAGNSTRMGELPKAVSLVHGTPNIYNTVEKALPYYHKIYVSSNTKNFLLYKEVLQDFGDKVQIVAINSGHGCGHAVLKTIDAVESDDLFLDRIEQTTVCWGDAYFESEDIFKEITNFEHASPIIIPAIFEENPYVWFTERNPGDTTHNAFHVMNSMFSKRGEGTKGGYHDQSIFRIDIKPVRLALQTLDKFLYKRSTLNYLHEIIFLDLVNYFHNIGNPCTVYKTKHKTEGYNTKEELKEINKK